jgi:protein involved in polysaccharide export with SLBB domain
LKVWTTIKGRRYVLVCVALLFFFHRASGASAQDLTVVGTPQQTNERIHTLSEISKSAPHEYTIGGGDLLSISVFDVPELAREVRVNEAGTIAIPLVPTRLHIAGLTETQAQQVIADVLQANGLVSHPEVSVVVREHKSKPITIVGAVQHPMVYEADRGVTLLEAIAEAGGVSNDAGDTVLVTRSHSATFVMVPIPDPISLSAPGTAASAESSTQDAPVLSEKDTTPNSNSAAFPSATELAQNSSPPANPPTSTETPAPSGNIITINLNQLLETGDVRNNIPLEAGDVVTVPHAGIVYVLGAVNRPGAFVMANDRTQLTMMKVIALAGGVTRIAKLDHTVIIRRDDQGKQTETQLNLKKVLDQKSEDLPMRPSDILYIPDNRAKEYLLQTLQLVLAAGVGVAFWRLAYQ